MSGSPKADPGLYGYWPYDTRPRIEWPGGARVALWIAPNIEFYEYAPPVNPHRKPWPRPLPDVLGYATRDYGNRVGHQRMMRVMDKFGLRGSVSLSTAVLEHHPEVIQMAAERNWEFFSHGIYNTRYTYGLDEAQEREMIEESMTLIASHTGQHCDGYLAPALSHSDATIDLFAEAGYPRAEVEVRAAPDGTITGTRLIQSSGNKAWDDAVLRALQKTETLPRDVDGRVPSSLVIGFRPKD